MVSTQHQRKKQSFVRRGFNLSWMPFINASKRSKNPLGKLKKAVNYALKARERIYLAMEKGELPLSNNFVEQRIRPTTIIRKNCLFSVSIKGAQANALFYSLVQTAKLNGLDVFKYLNAILEATRQVEKPDWRAYLPWSEQMQATCKA